MANPKLLACAKLAASYANIHSGNKHGRCEIRRKTASKKWLLELDLYIGRKEYYRKVLKFGDFIS